MFSLVEALNFRCLRYVRQELGTFHVLVGANASGKTTFLDVTAFLSRLVSDGLQEAIAERARTFQHLLWAHGGESFELAVEAPIPSEKQELLAVKTYDTIRYEVRIGIDPDSNEIVIGAERGWLTVRKAHERLQRLMFPASHDPPTTVVTEKRLHARSLFSKNRAGNDNYYADARERDGRWAPSFRLGPRKSTLGNLPEDEVNFPVSTWFKQLLVNGVQQINLNSLLIRNPSPPGQIRSYKPDGSNLPWVISRLEQHDPERLNDWIKHVQTALPDIQAIKTIERPEDKHRYLVIVYQGGLEVPSWLASDGTLRLLALTLLAYVQDFEGTYLIEEPENGIHPRAVETMFASLSSVYSAQILMATHSPVILSIVDPKQVLCFAKTDDGATDIVRGDEHPALQNWRHEENLGILFASGVLG